MAFDLGGFLGTVVTTALPAILGTGDDTAPTAGTAGPVSAVALTAPGGGDPRALTASAMQVLSIMADGASDAMVRSAARDAGVSKKQLFLALMAVDILSGKTALSSLEKIAISDQIERIFRRKRRPAISRADRNIVKKVKFYNKAFGGGRSHAHTISRSTTRKHS